MAEREMLLLWDRDCGFCAWMLARLLQWDRRGVLRTAPIQGPEGDRWLAGMPEPERLRSWHSVDRDGTVRSGGAALPAVLDLLPGGGPFHDATAALPGVTDAAYRWVAGHRSLLSKPIPAAAKDRARRLVADRDATAVPGR